jgi:diguanylate cyclase (GGDEF)-like protein
MSNVVIVDDQTTDRQILDRLTRNLAEDIEVYAFALPGEALAWLRDHQPDLILVDYRMPEMDGITFIENLAHIPHCLGIPIIVITVVEDTELRYRALEAGATDFLNKPLDLQESQARCRNLLALRRMQLAVARHAEEIAEAGRRTGRALRILSLANELLIDTRGEPEFLQGMCHVISEQAGYPLVRIALWDEEEYLHQAAGAGVGEGQRLDSLTSPQGAALAATMRANKTPWWLNDLSAETRGNDWLDALRDAGLRSVALLPVRVEGLVEGVLAVVSDRAGVFDQDELELLERTGNNLGYGLADRRARRARDRAERDCRYLTHFDRLTGLPNRNWLLERVRDLAASHDEYRRTAVLVINLDRFKLVNDTAGHEAGDRLLIQVVQRLHAIVPPRALLARQSGDEFVLLLHKDHDHTSGDQHRPEIEEYAGRTAKRMIETMHRPFEIAGYEYYIGASVGISLVEPANDDFQSALRQADTAMRQAKDAGGNRHSFYSGELTERHTRRLSLEARLRRAIEQDVFILHYQPIMVLESGDIAGVEALVRWPQDDGSLLAPDAFIPLAEETGLMESLGYCVARQACRQARAWNDEGLFPRISMNLSVHQLLRPGLVDEFVELMESSGTDAAQFELEVTESAMMTDPARTERIVHTLYEHGIGIALDDFGMGYSSLSRLKHLPITTIKIDKTFVSGLPNDPAERTIVRSIIQLAENMRVRAVAEGIETIEHRNILVRMDCRFGQGFHFSHPLPANELRAILSLSEAVATRGAEDQGSRERS